MGVVAHEEGVLHAVVGEVLVEHEGALVGHVVLLAHADPVQLVAGLLDALQVGVEVVALADAAAQGADVAEYAGIEDGRGGGVAAAHGQARDGAAVGLGDGPVC